LKPPPLGGRVFTDTVIAVKTEAGPVKLNQLVNMTAAGAAGSFWGLLIGVLFLNPIIGVALGAASGALAGALTDYGINDVFMKDLAAKPEPGHAALFVLIQNMTADKVLREIPDTGGTVLKTSLDDSKENRRGRSSPRLPQSRLRSRKIPPSVGHSVSSILRRCTVAFVSELLCTTASNASGATG
jgi:uncharacterized membrane protein